MKKAGDRLCMHLNDKRLEEALHNFIAGKAAKRIKILYFFLLTDLPRPLTFLKGPSFRPFKLDIARSIRAWFWPPSASGL